MSRPPLNKRLVALLISLLMISLACNTLTGASPECDTTKYDHYAEILPTVPAPFNLPDQKLAFQTSPVIRRR